MSLLAAVAGAPTGAVCPLRSMSAPPWFWRITLHCSECSVHQACMGRQAGYQTAALVWWLLPLRCTAMGGTVYHQPRGRACTRGMCMHFMSGGDNSGRQQLEQQPTTAARGALVSSWLPCPPTSPAAAAGAWLISTAKQVCVLPVASRHFKVWPRGHVPTTDTGVPPGHLAQAAGLHNHGHVVWAPVRFKQNWLQAPQVALVQLKAYALSACTCACC